MVTRVTRKEALTYVSYAVDDALSERDASDIPPTARLVGWQCGFEPLFVAVWSAYDQPGDIEPFDADEAVDIATDFLCEREWFVDNDNPPDPDYVI